jgi:hypothetical protein
MRPMLILAILLAACVATGSAEAGFFDFSIFNITYNFKVKIFVSPPHAANYTTPFNRPGNFTINITKIPKAQAGVTPVIPKPLDTKYDIILNTSPAELDPQTCPNSIAYCYQLIEHYQNRTTYGKNYSAISSFLLPERRIRSFVCVGSDAECVQSATNCFCPTQKIPQPPVILGEDGKCTSPTHMCLTQDNTFALCTGNLTICKQQYQTCGCGLYAACVSGLQTCVDSRDQLVQCKGGLADCLKKYSTCYCGPDMLALQQGCKSLTHQCLRGSDVHICHGSFSSCALSFDKCDC